MNSSYFLPVQRQPGLLRPRVIERALRDDPALIVLMGGGGSGKTIAAAQIAHAFVERRNTTHESIRQSAFAVWVRLAPDDISCELFWLRVFQTLNQSGLVSQDSTAARLAQGGLSGVPTSIIASAFSALSGKLLLVIDDAHHTVTDTMEKSLLDVLELTQSLTVLVTTRHSLSRLTSTSAHVRVPVRELDGQDLALSSGEIDELLQLRLPGLTTDERASLAENIHQHSRGWPLAAHALVVEGASSRRDTARVRQGSFVREFVDHLLESNDPNVQIALCASALFEEISAEALGAMLEFSADQAEALLASVFEISFGFWVDHAGTRWYRHQDLIRVELQSRAERVIGAASLRGIYARAAVTLRTARPRFAKEAAIHAQAWELLSDLLISQMHLSLQRERSSVRMSSIPDDVREQYPVIAAFALIDEYAFPSGRFGQVITGFRLLTARRLVKESEEPGLPGLTAAALRMVGSRLSGNESVAVQMAERVQEVLDQIPNNDAALHSHSLEIALTQTAITLLHAGRFGEVDRLLEPFIAAGNEILPRNLAHGTALAAWSSIWQGNTVRGLELIQKGFGLDVPVRWHDSYIGAGLRIAAALNALEQGDPDQSHNHLEALSEHEPTIEHWPFMTYVATLVAESRLGPEGGLDYLTQQLHRRRGRSAPLPSSGHMLRTLRARLLWQSGQVLPAGRQRSSTDKASIYIALSRGENDVALGLSASLSHHPSHSGNPRGRAELLLLRAEGARRVGDEQAAATSAQLAASLMQEHDLTLPMRVIPKEAAHQLALFVPNLPVAHSSQGSTREVRPLTHAERRSLRAVIELGSVRAAADSLFLSPDTVKGYMKQVYKKLGVRSRTEAIRVASEARLLDDVRQDSD